MPNAVENFLSRVRETPQPSRELVEEGAYPVQTETGAWVMPLERVRPIVAAYYERSFALDLPGLTIFRDWDPHSNYFLTNAAQFPLVLPKIRGTGGVFVGPGMSLPFTFAAAAGASHAFVVDYDASVPLSFTPLYGALLAMAPTRAHFISLVTGRPVDAEVVSELAEKNRLGLLATIDRMPDNKSFAASIRDQLGKMLSNIAPLGGIAAPLFDRWFRMMGDYSNLLKIRQTIRTVREQYRSAKEPKDEYGPDELIMGGLLSSEAAYAAERALFLQGRFTGVPADLTSPDMNLISGAIEAMGERLGVFHMAKADTYLLYDESGLEQRARQLLSLYENITRMPRAADALIVALDDTSKPHIVDRVGNFMRYAAPSGLEKQQTAEIAFHLLALRTAASHSLPFSMLKWLSEWGSDFDQTVMVLLFDTYKYGLSDRELDWKEFDARMTEKSEIYRNMEAEERKLFLLYLMNFKVIHASYPYMLEKGSALINVMNMEERATIIGGAPQRASTGGSSRRVRRGVGRSPCRSVRGALAVHAQTRTAARI